MNLNDFNRYAEDFEEKKGGWDLIDDEPLRMEKAGIIDRISAVQMLQQQIVVGSTSVENVEDTLL